MPKSPALRTALLAALLIPAGCATLFGPSDAQRRAAAHRVLAAYDVTGMLEQVAPIINDSLQTNLPTSVTEAQRARLARTVRENYQPKALTADLADRLMARAAADQRKGVLIEAASKLETPLAKAMIARERMAATDAFAAGFREFLKQPVKAEDAPRLEQARTLVERMRLVALQTVFNVGMLRGMVAARNAVAGSSYQTSEDSADQMAARTERSLRKRMERQLPIMLFYAYRDATDAELTRYAELQNTPALTWVNQAITDALAATLSAAAERLPEQYRQRPGAGDGQAG